MEAKIAKDVEAAQKDLDDMNAQYEDYVKNGASDFTLAAAKDVI